MSLMTKGRDAVQEANRHLRGANEQITRSVAHTREIHRMITVRRKHFRVTHPFLPHSGKSSNWSSTCGS
jgi:hypothetical protein